MTNKSYIWLILFTLLALSCSKDSETSHTTIIKNPPRVIISNSELVINVEDENGIAIEGLTAVFNDSIQVIEGHSFFHFKGNSINKFNEILKVTDKEGNEHQYTTLIMENEVNYRKINVFINKQQGEVNALKEKTIQLSNGHLLKLPANNYLSGLDADYKRQVNIKYNMFDLQNANHINCLPGGRSISVNNVSSLMLLKAAFDFRLLSDDNKQLKLKTPAKYNADINEKSHVVYYNTFSGQWDYIAEFLPGEDVSLPFSGTYAIVEFVESAILKGEWKLNSFAQSNAEIQFSSPGFESSIQTSNSGKWELVVPRYALLDILYSDICGKEVKGVVDVSESIQVLPTLNTQIADIQHSSLAGHLIDCFWKDVDNGFIELVSESSKKILWVQQSNFNLTFSRCSNENYKFRFIDLNSGFVSRFWKLDKGEINFGELTICDDLKKEYVIYKIDNDITTYTEVNTVYTSSTLEIIDTKGGGNPGFWLRFTHGGDTGILDTQASNIKWNNPSFGGYGILINCPSSNSCGFEKIEINYLEENDDYIRGRFNGKFWSQILSPSGAGYKEMDCIFQVNK